MSLELKDLRCKIEPQTWAILEAEARATGRDQCEIVRKVLGDWARVRHTAMIEAHRLLTAEGFAVAERGKPGRGGEHVELRWE